MNDRVKITMRAPDGAQESTINGHWYFVDNDGNVETTSRADEVVLKLHGYRKVGEVALISNTVRHAAIPVDELGRTELAEALRVRGMTFPADATRGQLEETANHWNNARRGKITQDQTAEAIADRREPPTPLPVGTSLIRDTAALIEAATAAPVVMPPDYAEYLQWRHAQAQAAAAPAPVTAPHRIDVPADATFPPAPPVEVAAPSAPVARPGTPAPPAEAPPVDPAAGAAKPDFANIEYGELKGYLSARGVEFKGNAKRADLIELAEKAHAKLIAAKKAA